jgi:hypothetical protein
MPARKVRIDMFDTEGNRYSINFEGQLTRDKALRLLDLVELLGGMPGAENPGASTHVAGYGFSKYDKVRTVVQKHFPVVWFSSREVQSVYEQELKEPISLSTVATYLSRMATKGLVLRSGPSNNLRYKETENAPPATVKQKIA